MVAYTTREAMMAGARPIANAFAAQSRMMAAMASLNPMMSMVANFHRANAIAVERMVDPYDKPAWHLDHTFIGEEKIDLPLNHTLIDGEEVAVEITPVLQKPFADLIHFKRDPAKVAHRNDPKVLVVGPMSGHYLTLLRGTFIEHLPHSEIYGTDWHNARDVPADIRFNQDDQIAYIKEMIEFLGRDVHVIAVCQPCGPTMTALTQLAAEGSPYQPLSVTYVAGPIDTGAAPSEVSEFPHHALFSPFLSAARSTVPDQFAGAGRTVHMGQAQLFGFMLPKMETHMRKNFEAWVNDVKGNTEDADRSHDFYQEYFAVMDLTAEFIDQHCSRTFINRDLANGTLVVDGKLINPGIVRKTAVMTVEGTNDDISTPEQTRAAHRIMSGVPEAIRFHHLQEGAGHYGCFEGSRFRAGIAPRQAGFIRQIGEKAGLRYSPMPAERKLIEPTPHRWAAPQAVQRLANRAATA